MMLLIGILSLILSFMLVALTEIRKRALTAFPFEYIQDIALFVIHTKKRGRRRKNKISILIGFHDYFY